MAFARLLNYIFYPGFMILELRAGLSVLHNFAISNILTYYRKGNAFSKMNLTECSC
jgi:hypothetical protein